MPPRRFARRGKGGERKPKKPMRPTGAWQLCRTAPTGLRSGPPNAAGGRLDPRRPQLNTHDVCRVCLRDLNLTDLEVTRTR